MPVDLQPGRSRTLQWLLLALCLLSILALTRLALVMPLMILLALPLSVYGYSAWRQLADQTKQRLSYRGDQWLLEIDGEQQPQQLIGATVWQALVALEFRQHGGWKKRRLLLLADNCDGDQLRRLRVLLRHFPVQS